VRAEILLAIECTGFVTSAYLSCIDDTSQRFPETIGREAGVMIFTRSVSAGTEQIAGARPLRFAVDIAISHFEWRIPPATMAPPPTHELFGQSLQEDVRNFIEHYLGTSENPVRFGGPSKELQRLDDWLATDLTYGIVLALAPAGKGKSALLVRWIPYF
jgi:hypothetical protein